MENQEIIEKAERKINEYCTQPAKKKINKKAIAIAGIAVIIVLIVIVIIVNKPIYKSEEEMYAAFNGIWVSSEDGYYNDIIIDNNLVTSFSTSSVFENMVNENGIEALKQAEYRDCVSDIKEASFNNSYDVFFDIKKGVIKEYNRYLIIQLTENGTLEISNYNDDFKEITGTHEYIKISEDASKTSFLNDYFEKDFYSEKESKIEYYLSPEQYFLSPKSIYEKVKPFFEKYGYDIDSWNVTADNGEIFAAETGSESIVLQDNCLVINLNKNGSTTRGLYYFTDNDNIQIWFGGGEQDKAYELLDVIFNGAQVNDKRISEYIQDEYLNHLNEGDISNWSNEGIDYKFGINNDTVFIMVSH